MLKIKDIKTGTFIDVNSVPPYKASGQFLVNWIRKGSYSVFWETKGFEEENARIIQEQDEELQMDNKEIVKILSG